jgi:hypothetical protein
MDYQADMRLKKQLVDPKTIWQGVNTGKNLAVFTAIVEGRIEIEGEP